MGSYSLGTERSRKYMMQDIEFLGPGSRTEPGTQKACWACLWDQHLRKSKGGKSRSREELNCRAVITEASTDPRGSSQAEMALQVSLLEVRGAGLPALCSSSCSLHPGEAALWAEGHS